MKETGTIKMLNNNIVLLKTILVISISSLTFFLIGFGFSINANGGLFGDEYFFGLNLSLQEFLMFIFYVSLCVKMAVIATGAIAERTTISSYIFFSFINSGFIFPVGLAWCWSDGWLENMGFIDIGGAGVVHIMGGVAGFIGTFLIGPRIGLFHKDQELSYVLDEELFLDDLIICVTMRKGEIDGNSKDGNDTKDQKDGVKCKIQFNDSLMMVNSFEFDRLVNKISLDMMKKEFEQNQINKEHPYRKPKAKEDEKYSDKETLKPEKSKQRKARKRYS